MSAEPTCPWRALLQAMVRQEQYFNGCRQTPSGFFESLLLLLSPEQAASLDLLEHLDEHLLPVRLTYLKLDFTVQVHYSPSVEYSLSDMSSRHVCCLLEGLRVLGDWTI